jgi:hypothetical protein
MHLCGILTYMLPVQIESSYGRATWVVAEGIDVDFMQMKQ